MVIWRIGTFSSSDVLTSLTPNTVVGVTYSMDIQNITEKRGL